MPRVLIAGAGSIGRRHLHNLRQLGVQDIHLYRTHSQPLKEAPELPVFTDLKRALESKPQAVIVSNPTAFHMEIAIEAARAGCHLLIEKPLAHSWDGVEELLSTVREKCLVAMVGFDLRFDPGLCRIKNLIEQEHIGSLIAIHAQVGQYLPDWRAGEDYRDGMSVAVSFWISFTNWTIRVGFSAPLLRLPALQIGLAAWTSRLRTLRRYC